MTLFNLLVSSYGKFLNVTEGLENNREELSKILKIERYEKYKIYFFLISKKHMDSLSYRRVLFIFISVLIILFSFYYLILFSALYYYSQMGWFYGGIASLILDIFGLMIILPLLGSTFRKMALGNKNLNWLIHFTKVDNLNYFIHN